MRIAPALPALGLALLTTLPAGCNNRPRTYPVRGTVLYQGKPVPNGTVNYMPEAGPSASGELQPDGTYQLTTYEPRDGAVPGSYTVVVVAMGDRSNMGLPEKRNPLAPPIVPEKYTSSATSPLRAEVKERENILDFTLEGKK